MHAVAVEDSRLLHSIPAARVALIERIARSAAQQRGPPATVAALRAQLLPRRRGGGPGGAQPPGAVARRARASGVCARGVRRVARWCACSIRRPPPRASSPRTRSCSRSPTTCPSSSTPSAWRSPAPSWPCTSSCTRCCRCGATGTGACWTSAPTGPGPTHAESWQLYEIDRLTDPAQLHKLQQDLEATLADVRVAVRDWRAMRERVRTIISGLENSPPPLPAAEVSEVASSARLDGGAALRVPRLPSLPSSSAAAARTAWCPSAPRASASSARRVARHASAATVLRGDVRATRARAGAAHHYQGELERHRAPRRAARLRRRKDLRSPRPGERRASLPRAVDLDRLSRQPARDPGAAPQGGAGHRALRSRSGQSRRQGGAQRTGDLSAR